MTPAITRVVDFAKKLPMFSEVGSVGVCVFKSVLTLKHICGFLSIISLSKVMKKKQLWMLSSRLLHSIMSASSFGIDGLWRHSVPELALLSLTFKSHRLLCTVAAHSSGPTKSECQMTTYLTSTLTAKSYLYNCTAGITVWQSRVQRAAVRVIRFLDSGIKQCVWHALQTYLQKLCYQVLLAGKGAHHKRICFTG